MRWLPVNIISGTNVVSKQFKTAFQPEQTKPTNRTEAMKLIVFPLLVLLLGDVSSTPLLMLPHCPEGKIWSTLWQRCENLPRPDQPRIVKINEASLIFLGVGGIPFGCMAGCRYSSRLGLPWPDQNIDQPTLAKMNNGFAISGRTTGCPAGCKYSSRLGECVCCNKEWNLYWFEYLGKCGRVYGK